MTMRKAPTTRGVAPPIPPMVPANPGGTSPRSPWELQLINNATNTITSLRVVRDENGTPLFNEDTAPALVDTLNTDTAPNDNINYSDVPPEQGKFSVIIDFSKGLTQDPLGYYHHGYYAWGESIWTVDTGGLVLRAPALVDLTYGTNVTALDARVESWCIHNFLDAGSNQHSTVWFSAGNKVYYLDELDSLKIKTPATQPAGTFRITQITSWQGILIVAHDTVDPYEWSTDSGATWHVASGGTQLYGKFFADYHEAQIQNNPAAPILVMSNDPNEVFSTEDPTDPTQWNSGSLVGQGGTANPDHNTSLTVAPTGELLVGKALDLFQLDAASDATVQAGASVSGDVALRMGPLPQSTDAGEENFAWMQSFGYATFAVAKDFDIVRFTPRRLSLSFSTTLLTPSTGFGPSFKLPAVAEAQKPIVAMATDHERLLFAALGGTEGYVLVGLVDDAAGENGWQWHGSVCRTNYTIRQMTVASFPLSIDFKDNYLIIARNDAPYTLSVMRIPRINALYDTGVTFTETSSVRFGPDYGGQAQVQKVFSRATPRTRNLNNPDPTVELKYRTLDGASFTSMATFNESPLPTGTSLTNSYAPVGIAGTFVELQAILTGDTSVHAALESVETLVFRRPIRKALLTATVYADNAGMTREGGRRNASWQELRTELLSCRDAVAPPLLIEKETGVKWTVDIQGWKRHWLLDNDGSGATMVVDLVMQELDTSLAPASGIGGEGIIFHNHATYTSTAFSSIFTLPSVPLLEPEVLVGRTYQQPGIDYTWTPGSADVVLTGAATQQVTIYYAMLP